MMRASCDSIHSNRAAGRRRLMNFVGLCLAGLAIFSSVESGGSCLANVDFLAWSDWYPLDRGQLPGERAYNWWIKEGVKPYNDYYHGQSVWNMPGVPASFPASYGGRSVDYFINWQCGPLVDDPFCERWQLYREIMSEGSAMGDGTYLEHWARGGRGPGIGAPVRWEVYYRPDAFADCTSVIAAGLSDAFLRQGDVKAPFLMRLPQNAGEEYVSPVVCTVIYDSYEIGAARVIPGRTSRWFVVNQVLEKSIDGGGSEVIYAQNLYFSDLPAEAAGLSAWCAAVQNPDYCQGSGESWEALTRQQEGVTGYLFAFEDYWMRRVPAENRLRNGFGAFHWWSWPAGQIEYDDVQVWHLDVCQEQGEDLVCQAKHRGWLPATRR